MKVTLLKGNTKGEVDITVGEIKALTDFDVALLNRVMNQSEKQGTKKVKTRSEVRGHSAKPFRQKGTGRGRQGSTKGPHHVGGGIAHGPKPDTTSLKINGKTKKLLLKKLLLASVKNNALKFIDLSDQKNVKEQLKGSVKTLLVYSDKNKDSVRKIQNFSNISLLSMSNLNPYSLIKVNQAVFDVECQETLAAILQK